MEVKKETSRVSGAIWDPVRAMLGDGPTICSARDTGPLVFKLAKLT